MSLPVIADTYQVSIGYSYGSVSTAANVLHANWFGGDAQTLADAVATAWWTSTAWPRIQSAFMAAGQIRVTPLDGTSTTAIANSSAFGVTSGQNSDPASSVAEALVVTQYTDVRGRSGRGRYYLPYVARAYRGSSGTSWDDGAGDIAAAYAQVHSNLSTGLPGVQFGVVSRLHSTFHPTVSEVVELGYIGTQRGRLRA
jgi:hypothetical protein